MSRPTAPHFWRDPKSGRAHIGAIYTDLGGRDYGPVAEVYTEGGWVHIVTDKYEGSVMLNLVALPLLIKELRRLQVAVNAHNRRGRPSPAA